MAKNKEVKPLLAVLKVKAYGRKLALIGQEDDTKETLELYAQQLDDTLAEMSEGIVKESEYYKAKALGV